MAKGRKTGGRKKGTTNKLTADLRTAIQGAFDKVGGQSYLQQVAQDDPRTFCKLLGMTLPKDVNLKAEGGLSLSITLSK
jgi:hypothetical protein